MANINCANDQMLLEFKKWPTILSELKLHAMTYFNGETQFNYAQCSKMCNKDIQRFDKMAQEIQIRDLKEDGEGVSITLEMSTFESDRNYYISTSKFINVGNGQHKWLVRPTATIKPVNGVTRFLDSSRVFQTDENATYDGTAMEGAARFLKQRLKNSTRITEVLVDTKQWPVELSGVLRSVCRWKIKIQKPSYYGFMDFMRDNKNNNLCIKLTSNPQDEEQIVPRAFFESDVFHNISVFETAFYLPADISDEQFLRSNAKMHFRSRIVRAEVINQKIKALIEKPIKTDDYMFSICYEPKYSVTGFNRKLEIHDILRDIPYREVRKGYKYEIVGANGQKLILFFNGKNIIFPWIH